MKLSLSLWYPGSGLVLECIDFDLISLSYFETNFEILILGFYKHFGNLNNSVCLG